MKRVIALLAVPGVQLLDISGPLDVFAEANRLLHRQVYELVLITTGPATICTSSGVKLLADRLLKQTDDITPHTFLVAGAPEIGQYALSDAHRQTIQALCSRSQRFGSVCTGAFLLAQTGLLQQRNITTHWATAAQLASLYPDIKVNEDALYVADGPVRTAAGVTSGMDLALRLVEEDLGQEVARDIAGNLVMFFRRPVNQTHFVRHSAISLSGRSALQDLQRWVLANLSAVTNVQDMAAHIGLSARHIGRLFRQELNVSAGEWLENERIARARTLLETGSLPLKTIADECGYSSCDILRRAFIRRVGISPTVYRKMGLEKP